MITTHLITRESYERNGKQMVAECGKRSGGMTTINDQATCKECLDA